MTLIDYDNPTWRGRPGPHLAASLSRTQPRACVRVRARQAARTATGLSVNHSKAPTANVAGGEVGETPE
jgi:hypothetical protein